MESGGSGDDPDGADGGDPPASDEYTPADDGNDRFPTAADGDPDDPAAADPDDPESEGSGWRFGLDEVDEDGIVRSSIEPGDIDLENALFVVLGAIAMVLVFVRLWLLVG